MNNSFKRFSIQDIVDPNDKYSLTGGPFGSDLKSSEYTTKGIRIIQLQNIGDGEFKDKYKIYTSEEKADSLSSCKIYSGEIILSKMGDPVARATLIPEHLKTCLMASDGIRIKVDEKRFNKKFILEQINAPSFRLQAENVSTGTTRKRIGLQSLKELTLDIPPLPKQKKIAEILSGIDFEISLMKNKKEKYNQLLKAITTEIFQKLRETCPLQKLQNVCSLITKGATPTTFGYSLSNSRFSGSITLLGGGSTSESGVFDLKPARYCTDKAISVLKRSQLSKGDSLVTIVGSIGNTCQIPSYVLPANINQNVALIRADQSLLSSDFVNLFLRTLGRQALIDIATIQAQPSVSLKQVGELQMPIPDIEHQFKINHTVKSIISFIDTLEKKIKKKELLKNAISCDLLSGCKRVNA